MSLAALAKLLGVKRHQAEDALHSERAARAVLSRRELFAASGALAAGAVFSFANPVRKLHPFMECLVANASAQQWVILADATQVPFDILVGETESAFRDRLKREIRRASRALLPDLEIR